MKPRTAHSRDKRRICGFRLTTLVSIYIKRNYKSTVTAMMQDVAHEVSKAFDQHSNDFSPWQEISDPQLIPFLLKQHCAPMFLFYCCFGKASSN